LVFVSSGLVSAQSNPSTIYAFDLGGASTASNTLMASLAGVVARTSPEVMLAYRTASPPNDPEFWLQQHVANNPGTGVVWQTNPTWYIDRYKAQLSGYVVYDAGSINQATSVAGARGALMIDQALLPGPVGTALTAAGLSLVEDVRGRSSDWVYDTYAGQFNRDMIFRQQPSFGPQLRSLAVLNKGFVFNETGATRDRYLANQNDHSLVYGWGYNNDETEFFSSASVNNLMGAPADHLLSAAAPSRWSTTIPPQAASTPENLPTDAGAHYVAFVMSDGDNVQWLSNDFARSPRWFGSPHRGDFPFTFDMSPAMARVNPTALRYFYEQAALDGGKTSFVTAGGLGLNYPSQTPDIEGFLDATIPAMTSVDQDVISVLDPTYDKGKLNAIARRPEIDGVMFKTNADAYKGNNGAIYWHGDKPVASVRYSLWDGFDTTNGLVAALNGAPRAATTDRNSYSIVNVHPWSNGTEGGGLGDPMSNVASIVSRLDPAVKVVTLDEFFHHLTQNRRTLEANTGPSVNLVRNGDFEVPAASPPNRPDDWSYASASGATSLANADSDGNGSRAAAIHRVNADWRSDPYVVQAGDELMFTFDFQFNGVPTGSVFRADARFFTGTEAQVGAFVGESATVVRSADYASGQWHRFTASVVVPNGATVGDVRLSTFFGAFASGTVLIDNVSLATPGVRLTGDYNGDGQVNTADYVVWRDRLGTSATPGAGADGDGDGVITGSDYYEWRGRYGDTVAAAISVPEPTGASTAAALLFSAVYWLRWPLLPADFN
jgi:hypothetical protein